MAKEIQYRNHTAYNNGTSAENNIKMLDSTPFQHEDIASGVNKLGKMLVAQSFCEPVAVCDSNNPQNGAYVATCLNYPDFALSYQDAQQNTQYLIGLKIRVIFTYGITYGSVSGGTYPTLNINGSGAIPMLAQGKTMATGSASAGQTLEFTVIPYGNGIAFDADSNVRESTSDYTIYTDGHKGAILVAKNTIYYEYKNLSAQGWYRLCTSNIQVKGSVLEIELTSSYNYQRPSSKKILISCGWSSSDIQILGNKDEDSIITKVRTVQRGSSTARTLYVDIYYNINQSNQIYAYLTSKNREITLNNFTPITDTPTENVTEKNI